MPNTERRPKDMTLDELEALPTGPFKSEFVPHTADEIANGAVGRGRTKVTHPGVRVQVYEPDDLAFFVDRYGIVRHFGQWADGTWFKS